VKLPFTVEKVDMEEQPVQTSGADELIQGKVAGVEVVKGSGQPGNAADIMLRGPTSLTGSQSPLVIVDGVITDNTLADIDALDIASIEVVKGAAASSLYGSRAANGVIQIQTKRASGLATDLSRVTLREELGTNNIEGDIALAQYHHYKMTADGQSFVDQYGNPQDYKAGVVLDDGGTSFTAFQDNPFPGKTYDHLDRFFRPGRFQRDYIAVDGKSGNTSYRASFTNSAETGVLEGNSGFTRRNLRVNVDHEVWSNLDLSLSTFYAQTKQEDIGGNPFFALTFMSPNIDLTQKDEDGYYLFNADPLSLEENPLYPIQFIQNWDRRTRFMGSLFVRFRPTGWFELEGNYSLDRQDYNQTNLTPKGYKTVDNPTGGLGSIWKWNGIENDINASVTASINYAFGDLTTRTKFRYLMEDQHSEEFDAQGNDLTVADIPVLDVAAGGKDVGSYLSDVISEGYYAISSLDYQGKYVADALIRRDGSSLFGADERWQTYYRGSLAWRMAQEDWWPLEVLDEFKLRYSYGTAGDRPGFAAQYETYSVSAGSISPVNLGNVNLKPAFAKEQEIGIDMVWFNQVAAGVTYANSVVEDQFLRVPLPGFAGFNNQWRNAGTLESNTFEVYVESALIDTPEATWSSRVNFDRTRQEITQLDVPPYRFGSNDAFYMREGEIYGTFYGNRFASKCNELPEEMQAKCSTEFQVNDDGYLVWVGAGNSYTDGLAKGLWGTTGDDGYGWGMPFKAYIPNPDDSSADPEFLEMGNTLPEFNLSWSNTFRWKNFQIYGLLDYEYGAEIYNGTAQWGYREAKHGEVDQFGKDEGQKKPVGYYATLYNVNEISSHFVEDGTYLKLREMSLRYTFDQAQLGRLIGNRFGLTQATINLVGRNLLTFTDFSGYDPEVGGNWGGSDAVGRIDSYQYPNYRTFSASLELVF
jgi:TonB-linked SusC/RagA family outer membrane protein